MLNSYTQLYTIQYICEMYNLYNCMNYNEVRVGV